MAEASIVITNSKNFNSVRPDPSDTGPIPREEDPLTILVSFSGFIEKNETNIRIFKQKLKTLIDLMLPVETYSTVINDMEKNFKLLEEEEVKIAETVSETRETIMMSMKRYEQMYREGELDMKKIQELEIRENQNSNKEEFMKNVKMGLIKGEEAKTHLNRLRDFEKQQSKAKTLALGQMKLSKKNLESLQVLWKIVTGQESMKLKINNFRKKFEELRKYESEIRSNIDKIENPRDINSEDLNNRVHDLVNTQKLFQSLYSEIATIRSELSTKLQLTKINEQIGLLNIELDSEEAGKVFIKEHLTELQKELDDKLKDHSVSTAQDLYMSVGEEVKVFTPSEPGHKPSDSDAQDPERAPLNKPEPPPNKPTKNSQDKLKMKKKSHKTMKIETEITKLKVTIEKLKTELVKKQNLQEKIDQLIISQQKIENESKEAFNQVNFMLSKNSEKYQILIHHMNRPKNVFSTELVSPLIGVLCTSFNVAHSPSIFSCFSSDEGLAKEVSLKEIYRNLFLLISKKVKFKKCPFWVTEFDRVQSSSVLELKELIDWIFENDFESCIKADNRRLDVVAAEDVFSSFAVFVKKMVSLIALQSQLQVKIGYENGIQKIKDLTSQTAGIVRELGYRSMANKIENPKIKKKSKYSTY